MYKVYIHMYMYVCVHTYIHVHICMYVCTCMSCIICMYYMYHVVCMYVMNVPHVHMQYYYCVWMSTSMKVLPVYTNILLNTVPYPDMWAKISITTIQVNDLWRRGNQYVWKQQCFHWLYVIRKQVVKLESYYNCK